MDLQAAVLGPRLHRAKAPWLETKVSLLAIDAYPLC